jgi:predicted alpha-1,6-mannanase (GH76 family)
MKNFVLCALAVSSFSLGGCAVVTSSMPSLINTTGEAWYTEAIGFFGLTWGSKVWYCPPPAAGPATCKEAKLIPMTKEELDAQKKAEKGE